MTDPHAPRHDLNRILAVRVKECMKALDLTQWRLAALAGVDERTIRRIVRGDGARLETIERVAIALHVEATSLLQYAA